MEILQNDKQKKYARYAWYCLKMVEILPDQKSRRTQREMAAEWLKLADQAAMDDVVVGVQAARRANGHTKTAPYRPSQLAMSLSPSLDRPPCPKCGAEMIFTLIEPHASGIDQRSFQCKTCNFAEKILVNFR